MDRQRGIDQWPMGWCHFRVQKRLRQASAQVGGKKISSPMARSYGLCCPKTESPCIFCDLLFDFCTTQQQKSASIALLTSPFLNIPLRLMKVLRGLLYMDKRS